MPSYIVLLRAINVGGRYYRMADLREHLSESGLEDVETYIQTGNVRCRSRMRSAAKVEAHVERVLGERCGFEVPAIVLSPAELREVDDTAQRLPPPFGDAPGQRRYVTFFKPGEVPQGEDRERLDAWDAPGESVAVVGRAVHVWLTHSTIDAQVYKKLRKPLAPGTARDLKVVTTLAERWGGPAGDR